jgi:PilZ domain
MANLKEIEHRRSRRVRMKQALRVRPLDPKDGSFEELGETKDVSQGGIYFVTEREVYYDGMRLSVVVPYAASGRKNYEYQGKVTRVEELGNGQRGVAIRFVSSTAVKPKPSVRSSGEA